MFYIEGLLTHLKNRDIVVSYDAAKILLAAVFDKNIEEKLDYLKSIELVDYKPLIRKVDDGFFIFKVILDFIHYRVNNDYIQKRLQKVAASFAVEVIKANQ